MPTLTRISRICFARSFAGSVLRRSAVHSKGEHLQAEKDRRCVVSKRESESGGWGPARNKPVNDRYDNLTCRKEKFRRSFTMIALPGTA